MSELAKKLIAENKRTQAKSLDLGYCGLRDLEKEVPELFQLTHLEILYLCNRYADFQKQKWIDSSNKGKGNHIVNIPITVKKLINLHTLYIGGNSWDKKWNFNHVSEIQTLPNLKSLYLAYSNIQDGNFLQNCFQLERLEFRFNKVSNIKFLKNLTNLHTLDLSGNQITNIKHLCELQNLHALDLSGNQILDYSILEKFKNLHTLYLSGNQISNIYFLENLSKIHTLDISYNQISDIFFLKKNAATGLTVRLDISNNYINDLSPIIALIKRGLPVKWDWMKDGICLENNPLTVPPVEIVKQGNKAILRYFEELERTGIDRLYEAKVLLVGEGNVGKTTLRKKLENTEAEMPPAFERTPGIDISRIPFQHTEKNNFFLNVWDFGGQDIYYNTHHFFLTKRSLYVLVTNTRSQEDNFDYWIPNIRLFGGKSPILVVKNKWQDAVKGSSIDRKISITRFRQNDTFNIPENIIDVNLYTKENLQKLNQTILHHATQLPLVGSEVPKSWVKVRNTLKKYAVKEAHISFSDFTNICREVGIEEMEKISDLARFFHDLGIVLWYENITALKNKVILQPEWITDAVYLIINDENIQRQKGHFSYEYAKRLLIGRKYRDMCSELLEMMKEFRLCYEKRSLKKNYIIPSLLSPEPPKIQWNKKDNIQLQYEYSFMPKGIVNQLSAELHTYIQSDRQIWGQGVILTDKNGLFKAKIEEDWFNRTIDIRTSGADARAILRRITDTIENDIHQYFPGVDFRKLVPCFCSACQKSEKPEFYAYDILLKVLQRSPTFFCNIGGYSFDIQKALFNIGEQIYNASRSYLNSPFEGKRRQKTPSSSNKAKKAKKLFIAYSEEDGEYLEELKQQLAILDRKGELVTWDDSCIFAGEDWSERTEAALKEADMILFLVSADFLANERIEAIEVATALRLKEIGKTAVVPIVIRPCLWKRLDFAKYSVLPPKGKPISKWADRDEAWLSVVEGIAELL